jgi:WS/DGAT/MGAT family acyltransferase
LTGARASIRAATHNTSAATRHIVGADVTSEARLPRKLRPLSGLDAAFLYLEAAGTPMHVGSVMLLQVPQRRRAGFHERLKRHIRERLPRAAVLRRVLVEARFDLDHPAWREIATVDLDLHIGRRRLAAPGTPAQLWRLVADLHAEPLPRDRPLWQFVVVDGLASGEIAFYSKVHHALLDGQGGTALAQALLDVQARPGAAAATGSAPSPHSRHRAVAATTSIGARVGQLAGLVRSLPETLKLAADAVREAGALLGSLRDAVTLAPHTPFNAQVGPRRSFAVASLPLDAVKRVARYFGTSLNDVVLALCAGALREHLLRRGALPTDALIAAMPISLRAAGDTQANNQVSMVQCALPTHMTDPVRRLQAIHAATGQLKSRVAGVRSLIPTDFPGFAAPIWATGLSRLWASGHIAERLPQLANLVVSNVPGPPLPLYLVGAKINHYYPVSIVTHGLGLNITVNSYAGWLEFGLIADRAIVARPAGLAAGLGRALRALGKEVEQ